MNAVSVCANPNPLKGEVSFAERQRQIEKMEFLEEQKEREIKGSPYNKFAQLNMEGTINEKVMYKLADCPAANKLFWFIANHMDGYNALIASYAVFQEALGVSVPTIARGIKYLKDNGLLHIKKSGSANVYMLNPKVIWKSWGNNMKYCEFPAKVLLAESEQFPNVGEVFSMHKHTVIEPKN
ncbi:MAG: helix-turn-helix domain-containing protein [Ruminococcaceae bacterium]|nr:helix-turn-helix domain-containing protein [Oscillospiraceae bacterium]